MGKKLWSSASPKGKKLWKLKKLWGQEIIKALEALRARNYEALIASEYVIFNVRLKI
jgi:hypothetical protein